MDGSEINEKVTLLMEMKKDGLADLWFEHFGIKPHPRLRTELMRPVLAYRIQEAASGNKHCSGKTALARVCHVARIRAGTRIVREWKGEMHEVAVTSGGYEYQGQTYRSLSPIAFRITGTKWSGPAFFGTKRKERGR